MSNNKQPNLVDDGFITNIGNKMKSNNNPITTETNMMVECFANKDKLVDEDQRVYYNNGEEETQLDDDDLNKYTPQQDVFNKQQQHHNRSSDRNHSDNRNNNNTANSQTCASETSTVKENHINPEDVNYWTEEELFLRKMDMLRKLGELAQAGVKLSQNYSMDCDYKTMKFEYELHTGIRSKQNAINWMSGMMIGIVKGMELLNDEYNPFDIKFEDTWSTNVKTNINDYYDVIGEIYEKYTKPGQQMAPELKLFLMLSGSAVSIQMHKGIKNLIPTVSEDINNDPDMVQNLREQAENRQRQQVNTQLNKDHSAAAAKVVELQQLNDYKKEYANLQKKAENSEVDRFANKLVLSESSIGTNKNIKPAQNTMQQNEQQQINTFNEQLFYKNKLEQQRRDELLAQNNKLIEMEKMLSTMNNEDVFIENNNATKPKPKPKQNSKPRKSNNTSSAKMPSSKKTKQQSSDTDNISRASTGSRISVNPHIEKILNNTNQNDNSSRSSISINIDDELNNLESSNDEPLQVVKNSKNIDLGNISFGRKSSGSGKRGRPPKNNSMKIKIGE